MELALSYLNFKSPDEFNKLKKYFVLGDIYQESRDVLGDDNPIIWINTYSKGEVDGARDIQFFADFLFPSIEQIHLNMFNNLKAMLFEKGLFDRESREEFIKEIIQRTRVQLKEIKSAGYLNLQVFGKLQEEQAKFEELLESYRVNPYPSVITKLQFNWSRSEIEYFFHLLRENKEINYISDADLGRIIDNLCQFKQDKGYSDIKGSRKHINDFKNDGGRGKESVYKSLSKKFNKDFFNK